MKPKAFSEAPLPPGWHDLAVGAWITVSAGTCALGWALSACGHLTAPAYGVAACVLFGLVAVAIVRAAGQARRPFAQAVRGWARRFRQPLPALFLLVLALILLGGCLYPPLDIDGTGYRIPRMLHWIQEGRWHWIHTSDIRMNNRGLVSEWLSLPLILFTRTDRLLFLLNVASFALLPGLFFQVFLLFRVSPRVARLWMWVLPAAFCYAVQAGGIGNDALAAGYVLAALAFARRFRRTGEEVSLYLVIISAALFSGVKVSNLPLLLPIAAALFPWRRLTAFRPVYALAALALAVASSFLPLAAINFLHTGDWTGLGKSEFKAPNPLAGVVGNTFQLTTQNFAPPIFLGSDAWNARMQRFQQSRWGAPFREFEVFGTLPRGLIDETVALGPGIMILLLAMLLASWKSRPPGPRPWAARALALASWIALLALLASSGLRAIGRIATPYYPLLLASLCAAAPPRWSRRAIHRLACAVIWFTVFTLVISRMRPLFPAQQAFAALRRAFPASGGLASAAASFSTMRGREEYLAPLVAFLPEGETTLGLVSFSGMPEHNVSRRPAGRFRIRYFLPGDSPEALRQDGVRFVILEEEALEKRFDGLPRAKLLRLLDATELKELQCQFTPSGAPKVFCLLRLNPHAPASLP